MVSSQITRRELTTKDVQIEILFCGVCQFPVSPTGSIAETQEMLDSCGDHNMTSDVEIIPIQKINEAYDRLLKSDVKYRFSIDMASLKSE